MQDFTGVPAVVDLAAMRDAIEKMGGDPDQINPLSPVDLVIDHSFKSMILLRKNALNINAEMEMERNNERYEFLRWGQKALKIFKLCHRIPAFAIK